MKVVSFRMGEELFGLPVEQVREIMMDRETTSVPNLPSFLTGVVQLRGEVLPIMEGADRLNLDESTRPQQGEGRILVVEFEDQVIGIRVNDTDDVLEVSPEDVKENPDLVREFGAEFVEGVVERHLEDENSESGTADRETSRRFSDSSHESTKDADDAEPPRNLLLLDLNRLFDSDEITTLSETEERLS